MKPPFTYFGGKTSIAERIAALLPPHEHYVEPFAGSLAVLLAKPPSRKEKSKARKRIPLQEGEIAYSGLTGSRGSACPLPLLVFFASSVRQ